MATSHCGLAPEREAELIGSSHSGVVSISTEMRHPVVVGERTMDAIGAGVGRFDHVDWRLVVVAVACQLLGSVCHARAWGNLLQAARPDSRVPRGAVLCAHLAGVAGNAVSPAHAGDAAKVVLDPPRRARAPRSRRS